MIPIILYTSYIEAIMNMEKMEEITQENIKDLKEQFSNQAKFLVVQSVLFHQHKLYHTS